MHKSWNIFRTDLMPALNENGFVKEESHMFNQYLELIPENADAAMINWEKRFSLHRIFGRWISGTGLMWPMTAKDGKSVVIFSNLGQKHICYCTKYLLIRCFAILNWRIFPQRSFWNNKWKLILSRILDGIFSVNTRQKTPEIFGFRVFFVIKMHF